MADYRLQQTGEVIQERLNQIPLNAGDIQHLQSEVTQFLNTQQVQQLINNALTGYSTTQEVAAAIQSAISTALVSYPTAAQMNAAIQSAITTALTSYSTTQEITASIDAAISTALALYYTKTEVDNKLAQKQNTLVFDLAPTLNSSNPVTSNGVKVAVDGEATARATADSQMMTLIVNLQTALLNYYLKTETYNRSEIDQLVAAVGKFQSKIVSTLPEPTLDTTGWIYLVPSDNPKTQNVKEEYITVLDGSTYKWEHIGSTNIDLSGYSTTEQMNTAIATALQAYSTTTEMNTAISSAISTALASYSTTQEMTAAISSAITTALTSYYTKTEVDAKESATNGRVLFIERGLGKYDDVRNVTLVQAIAGKYVNVNGQEVSASGYGISAGVQLNAGDIMLVPSASPVPADVSLFARIVTRTYDKVITYSYTYRQDYPELPATATADYNPALIYTAQYDESGDTPVLTGWAMGGQTYTTLPATRTVTESYYEPLMKQAVAAMPSTGYYVYLCPTSMTIVVSGYTATVSGGVALVVGLGIFKNIATNFIGAPGQAVIAQAFAQLLGEIEGLKAQLDNLGETRAVCINSEDVPKVQNYPMIVYGAGAPSAPNVPAFIGQKYLDTTNKKEYTAFSVTNSVSDWVLVN
jgi:hypothetical protein